jgi:uncharacterized protein (DUF433 family)
MSASIQYPHLTIDAAGVARIGNTRYKVLHLAGEHYHYGWSAEELLRQHPDLRPQEVHAALTYFYDHYDDLVRQLEETAQRTEDLRPSAALSREELLRRKKLAGPA